MPETAVGKETEGMSTVDSHAWDEYAAEAKDAWGATSAYAAFEKQTKGYTEQRWEALAEGFDRVFAGFATCLQQGIAPDSDRAQTLVQALRDHVSENCYPCTCEILTSLGQIYTADERFRRRIDRHADGTAAFIRQAIDACCVRQS